MSNPFKPPAVVKMSGSEPLAGGTVRDFWAWSLSDMRANTVRSMLAEYLVAVAVGSHHRPRVEWDSWDVTTPAGVRVEVKASAYLQAWEQKALSKISFSGLAARRTDDLVTYAQERTYNAAVYVFAVQTAQSHDVYDALDTDTWRFWVIPVASLERLGYRTIGLARVQALGGDHVAFAQLGAAIDRAAAAGDISGI